MKENPRQTGALRRGEVWAGVFCVWGNVHRDGHPHQNAGLLRQPFPLRGAHLRQRLSCHREHRFLYTKNESEYTISVFLTLIF